MKKRKSSQDTIPFEYMFSNGLCKIKDNIYSKSLIFSDRNYFLESEEEKNKVFTLFSNLINVVPSDYSLEFTYINRICDLKALVNNLKIKPKDDDFNLLRDDYFNILINNEIGNNKGKEQLKIITLTTNSNEIKSANIKLDRVINKITEILISLDVKANVLDGNSRLNIISLILNNKKLAHNFKDEAFSGLNSKDFISPMSLDFKDKNYLKFEENMASSCIFKILNPPFIEDNLLNKLLDIDNSIVTFHVKPLDQLKAIKLLKRKISDIDKMKIDEQKRAVRSGYDMDIMPTDIKIYGQDALEQLEDIQNRGEHSLFSSIIITFLGDKKQIDNNISKAKAIANINSCEVKQLEYLQEKGFFTSLPIGINNIEIERNLSTSALAIMTPFKSVILPPKDGYSYYGVNAYSKTLIFLDRKNLRNPNGLILGTPGSGKSFSAKREMVDVFLKTDDDIIVCDPEGEYYPLVNLFNGQVIKISSNSKQFINPLDLPKNDIPKEELLNLKSDFILSFFEKILNSNLSPVIKSVIDRCIPILYKEYFNDFDNNKIPTLEDLYNLLKNQPEEEIKNVILALEIYVHGSLNVFNHKTNVNLNNRFICFDIKELGQSLKEIGMLIVEDQVWNRVSLNRNNKKYTRYYMDEFHLLLKNPQTAAYSVEIFKRFRKWGGIPTGITQNVKDLLSSREIENIFENSDFIYLLNQAPGDREILVNALGISKEQEEYIKNVNAGSGLIIYNKLIVPFFDSFPKDSKLYSIMNTKPN